MPPQIICVVRETSDVGSARRNAQRVAEDFGFSVADAGRVALIATELANNLVKHGRGGHVLVQEVHEPHAPAIELLAIDAGPGMDDVDKCLRDGYSTAGTAGTGLGAIKRAATEFDVFTQPERGCVVMARVCATTNPVAATSAWRWGAITAPYPGETAIGDCWRVSISDAAASVMVADGLGHGPLAAEASEAAARVFDAQPFGPLKPFLEKAHAALRSTRGAVVAAAVCPSVDGQLRFAGAGNIAATILRSNGDSQGLMSYNGTVGSEMRTVHELMYDWRAGDKIVMHSDGLTSRWSLKAYPRLLERHPSVISAILWRDFTRGRDDATVVVMERAR